MKNCKRYYAYKNAILIFVLIFFTIDYTSFALRINYKFSKGACFTHKIYFDTNFKYELSELVKKVNFKVKNDDLEIDMDDYLCETFGYSNQAEKFNYFLSKLIVIENRNAIRQSLDFIEESATKEELVSILTKYYSLFEDTRSNKEIDPALYTYLKNANDYVNLNIELINEFYKKMLAFYGVKSDPLDEINVYVVQRDSDLGAVDTSCVTNNILLGVSKRLDFKTNFGTVMHEIAHIVHNYQPFDMRKNVQLWFLSTTQSVSTLAYTKYHEALADAIGNGLFLLNTLDKEDLSYNDDVILKFSTIMFHRLKNYFQFNRTIDQPFVQSCINDLSEVIKIDIHQELHDQLSLGQVLVHSSSFDCDKIIRIIDQYYPTNNRVYTDFKNIKYLQSLLDTNKYGSRFLSKILVLSIKDANEISKTKATHPLLSKIGDLKSLEQGAHLYKDELGKYVFILVIKSVKDLDKLLQIDEKFLCK